MCDLRHSDGRAVVPRLVEALSEAGLKPGDALKAIGVGPGKVLLEEEKDPLDELIGSMPGVYEPGYLRKLREEWDRR